MSAALVSYGRAQHEAMTRCSQARTQVNADGDILVAHVACHDVGARRWTGAGSASRKGASQGTRQTERHAVPAQHSEIKPRSSSRCFHYTQGAGSWRQQYCAMGLDGAATCCDMALAHLRAERLLAGTDDAVPL